MTDRGLRKVRLSTILRGYNVLREQSSKWYSTKSIAVRRQIAQPASSAIFQPPSVFFFVQASVHFRVSVHAVMKER